MIGRTFYKRLRLPNGRSECVTTRFELDEATGQLVEHITMQTHEARLEGIAGRVARAPTRTSRSNFLHGVASVTIAATPGALAPGKNRSRIAPAD